MRAAALVLVPALLAACDSREVTSICASVGDPVHEVTAAAFTASGNRTLLRSDGDAGTVLVMRDMQDRPSLPDLWLVAENTMRIVPEIEWSPCGLPTRTVVRVTYDDGSVMERETSCEGNALSRVATAVLEAAETDRITATVPAPSEAAAPVETVSEACEVLS